MEDPVTRQMEERDASPTAGGVYETPPAAVFFQGAAVTPIAIPNDRLPAPERADLIGSPRRSRLMLRLVAVATLAACLADLPP
jgi:hypothetical protein